MNVAHSLLAFRVKNSVDDAPYFVFAANYTGSNRRDVEVSLGAPVDIDALNANPGDFILKHVETETQFGRLEVMSPDKFLDCYRPHSYIVSSEQGS